MFPVLAKTLILFIVAACCCAGGAFAQEGIVLLVGETKQLAFGAEAQALLLTNPAIAEIASPSNRYVALTGRTIGTGDVVAIGPDGAEILRVGLSVGIDIAQLQAAIDRSQRGAVSLATYDGAVVLNGTVAHDRDAAAVAAVVQKIAGASTNVIDNMKRGVGRHSLDRRPPPKAPEPPSRVGFLLR